MNMNVCYVGKHGWEVQNDGSVSYHGGSLYKPRLHGPSANTTDLVKTKEKRFRRGS